MTERSLNSFVFYIIVMNSLGTSNVWPGKHFDLLRRAARIFRSKDIDLVEI